VQHTRVAPVQDAAHAKSGMPIRRDAVAAHDGGPDGRTIEQSVDGGHRWSDAELQDANNGWESK
jgi:hypothetical protein